MEVKAVTGNEIDIATKSNNVLLKIRLHTSTFAIHIFYKQGGSILAMPIV